MSYTREFYPMITRTIKSLIRVINESDESWFLTVLQSYPDVNDIDKKYITPIISALIEELDRQYDRWNKGGCNGK